MKISGLWAGLLFVSVACARAQVTVEVTQDQLQFLPGEALRATVRITNMSGRELNLGGEEDWLTFAVESREGVVVPKLDEVPVLGAFTLPSSKAAVKRVDLAPHFLLTQPGAYQIVATVRVRDWNREMVSPPKSFDLIQGVKIWEQEVGVPSTGGTGSSVPEMRRYILQQANYIRGQIRLYLRVMDQYGKSIRVFAVGPMVSFGRPEAQVDRNSSLHVLHQDGASSFNYIVCNPEGEITARRTYEYVDTRPRLRVEDDGNVSVIGGVRRVAASDVPPPQEADSGGALSSEQPKPANAPLTNQVSVTKRKH